MRAYAIDDLRLSERFSGKYQHRLERLKMIRTAALGALRDFAPKEIACGNATPPAGIRMAPKIYVREDFEVHRKVKTRPMQRAITSQESFLESASDAGLSASVRTYPMHGSIIKSMKKLPREDRTLEALDYMIRSRGGEMRRGDFMTALAICNVKVLLGLGSDCKLVNTNGKAVKMNNSEGKNIGTPYMLNIIRELMAR